MTDFSSSSSSANSSMSSPPPPPPSDASSVYTGEWEYDVFLCFRGDDTRLGFTSHLMAALSDKQIRTFIDDKLDKTESIDELIPILKRSALSVVVFSDKFADSPWCLEEVATIARSMTDFKHRVLPVFYKVDPSDVTDDSGSYAATVNAKFEGNTSSEDKKKRWMDALKAVANCAGHTSKAIKIESELVKAIVEDVQKQLIDMSPSIKSANLVGMGTRIFEVDKLLAMDTLDDTSIIGLWGMDGIGKTTLAEACYRRITSTVKGIKHHFVRNINEYCEKHHGVEGIVRELYSELLSENNLSRADLDIKYRRGRLSRSRVFIVLDDVETLPQLEQLLLADIFSLTKLFAAGSRIIVTTKNRKVLQNAMAKIYNVECLNEVESTKLFSLHAFRQDCPQDNWMDQSCLATSYCKGNPLALRILGGALFGEDIQYWQSFLSELRRTPNLEIHYILRRSYDKLGAAEKRIFLDVACFLHGISRSRLVEYMTTMHPAAYAKVKDLLDKSVLTNAVLYNRREEIIEVHDLLKEMAWNIVNEESVLGKRSRLADADDIHKLLTTQEVKYWSAYIFSPFKVLKMVLPRRKKRRAADMDWKGYNPLEEHRTTEGISLDLSKANEMYLEANAFEGMNSLTFLKFWLPRNGIDPHEWYKVNFREVFPEGKKKLHLPNSGLNSLPAELRWLEWDRYPSKSLPSKFYPQHLVHLAIRESPIERCWEGNDQPQLVNLMVLDLSRCPNLIAIPDLSKSLKLEELLLSFCKSLVEVPSHVQYLTKLIKLDLRHCHNLECLPSKLDSKLLTEVSITNCDKVTHCPEIKSDVLEALVLDGTPVRELPSASYMSVKDGGTLSLYGQYITNFPPISASLGLFRVVETAIREMDVYDHCYYHQTSDQLELPRFHRMVVNNNWKLARLTKSIWNMAYDISVRGSPLIESLPEISDPVNGISWLTIMDCPGLKSVPSSINNLKSLEYLSLENLGIKSLPSSIEDLDLLCSLVLKDCKSLESLPSNLHKLSHLHYLSLSGCKSIGFLAELPPNLETLDVGGCESLQAVASSIPKGRWRELRFDNCPQLEQTFSDEFLTNFLHQPYFFHPQTVCPDMLQCWRSELPGEFSYKSVRDSNNMKEFPDHCISVKVELPPVVEGTNQLFLHRIAFGVVCCSNNDRYPWRDGYVKCECLIDDDTTVAFSSSAYYNFQGGDGSADNLFLWMEESNSSRAVEERKGRKEEWYVKYAGRTVSFRFDSLDPIDRENTLKIKSCGVSLFYDGKDDIGAI